MIKIDLGPSCCPDFTDPWSEWLAKLGNPAAILKVTDDSEYMEKVGGKTRNMCRKGEKFYHFAQFRYNDYLDDMHEINCSMPLRQGKPMTAAYQDYPRPMWEQHPFCFLHQKVWIGAFPRGRINPMVAYAQLVIMGNFVVINKIIGHEGALGFGVMNALVRHINTWCYQYEQLDYINYLTMDCNPGLAAFKKHTGFENLQWKVAG